MILKDLEIGNRPPVFWEVFYKPIIETQEGKTQSA